MLYKQAVNWAWSMAEPNVTIVSASIPVLRGFSRNLRTKKTSASASGPYVRTGDSSNLYDNAGRRSRTDGFCDYDGSDRSILGPDSGNDNRTKDAVVRQQMTKGESHASAEGIEMSPMRQ